MLDESVDVVVHVVGTGEGGDLVQKCPHGGGQPDRPLVATDRGDCLCDSRDGVVRVSHGAVSSGSLRSEPEPGDALLGGLDQIQALAFDDRRETSDLSDRFGACFEPLPPLIGQRMGAQDAARLLVSRERQRDGTARLLPSASSGAHHGQDRCVEVLHVDGSPSPYIAVHDFGCEGVDLPVVSRGRYDVEVAVHQQPVAGAGVPPVGHHRRTALCRLEQQRFDADVGQESRHILGRDPLPRPGVIAVVRGVDADQVTADLGDLRLRSVAGAHLLIMPPRQHWGTCRTFDIVVRRPPSHRWTHVRVAE